MIFALSEMTPDESETSLVGSDMILVWSDMILVGIELIPDESDMILVWSEMIPDVSETRCVLWRCLLEGALDETPLRVQV